MLRYRISCDIMWYHIISYYIILYHIIISYYIINIYEFGSLIISYSGCISWSTAATYTSLPSVALRRFTQQQLAADMQHMQLGFILKCWENSKVPWLINHGWSHVINMFWIGSPTFLRNGAGIWGQHFAANIDPLFFGCRRNPAQILQRQSDTAFLSPDNELKEFFRSFLKSRTPQLQPISV